MKKEKAPVAHLATSSLRDVPSKKPLRAELVHSRIIIVWAHSSAVIEHGIRPAPSFFYWGVSSAGRAPHSHCGDHRFESGTLHQNNSGAGEVEGLNLS